MNRATWHVRASVVVFMWLLSAAVASLIHRQLPTAEWLPVHLLLLGAVSNALLIWSWHFTQAILRIAPMRRRAETTRLLVFNAGALLVMAGMVTSHQSAVVAGAALATGSLIGHVVTLIRALRRALPSRFAVAVRYYVAAAGLAVPGLALGVMLSQRGTQSLLMAHVSVVLLGWVGLPILGTLLTLWPTMLHTRIVDGAERDARRALPGLLAGITVLLAGLLFGVPALAVTGIVVYAGASGWIIAPMVTEMRQRPPTSFAAWSTLAGVAWLGVGLAGFAVAVVRGVGGVNLTAIILVGGVLQVLLGSMTYLMPVVTGGGPVAMRARIARADRAVRSRLLVTNLGLALYVLPSPSAVRVTASLAVLGALLTTVAMIVSSMRIIHADQRQGPAAACP